MIIWSDCIGTKRRFINLAPLVHRPRSFTFSPLHVRSIRFTEGVSYADGWEDYGKWLRRERANAKLLREYGFRVSDGTNEYRWRT